MNYKIITSEGLLNEFVNWLPDLLPTEQYYITLLARKKYNKDCNLKQDKNQLKRVTATKDRIVQKIQQMECEVGSYTFEGEPISQDNLCVYITPNPRDLYKASLNLLKEIATRISQSDTLFNPQSLAMSVIQTSTYRKIYFDTDVDFKRSAMEHWEEDMTYFYRELEKCINLDCVTYVRTRGGLHALIKLEDIDPKYAKTWYNNVAKLGVGNDGRYDLTMNSDNLLPLPGCTQGGFTPSLIS